MNKRQKDRLLKLADFLEKVPSQFYNQAIYCGPDVKGHEHDHASIECGTPACALGWATAIFKNLHLVYSSNSIYGRESVVANGYIDESEIIERFFGVKNGDWVYKLFGGNNGRYRTPKIESALIRRYIDDLESGRIKEDE